MEGQISFDVVNGEEEDASNFEGCFRIPPGEWTVFNFTRSWSENPGINKDAVFSSGVRGVNVNYPKDETLNKIIVKEVLSQLFGIETWSEVRGPDSLMMK